MTFVISTCNPGLAGMTTVVSTYNSFVIFVFIFVFIPTAETGASQYIDSTMFLLIMH